MNPQKPKEFTFTAATGEKAELVNTSGHGVDIYTKEKFGDCTVSLELMVPVGSNSGVYLMGEYEIQVLDSWGVRCNQGSCRSGNSQEHQK